jgi:hypothetical protein
MRVGLVNGPTFFCLETESLRSEHSRINFRISPFFLELALRPADMQLSEHVIGLPLQKYFSAKTLDNPT